MTNHRPPDDDWLHILRPQREQDEPGDLPTVINPVSIAIDWRELEY
jgi:hypothetical protein